MGIIKRKKYLINPGLQFTVIGFNLILALLMMGIFYAATSYLFSKFTGVETALVMDDPIIAEMIAQERARLNMILAVASFAILTILVLGGLVLSHRIAGPIYHLRQHMRQVIDGKTNADVKFRKNDFFSELAEDYNSLLKRFR